MDRAFRLLFTVVFNMLIICFSMAALGLRCFSGLSPVVASGGCSLAVVHGLLVAVASLVEHRHAGFSSFGAWALEHRLNSRSAQN